jgi:hypothetical protein
MTQVVLAYEPIWAIGTGMTATPDQAQAVHQHIRSLLGQVWGSEVAQTVRVQYGGSVRGEYEPAAGARRPRTSRSCGGQPPGTPRPLHWSASRTGGFVAGHRKRRPRSVGLYSFRSTGRCRRITGKARDPESGHRKRRPKEPALAAARPRGRGTFRSSGRRGEAAWADGRPDTRSLAAPRARAGPGACRGVRSSVVASGLP